MKASLFLFALPFLFSSCLVVKIYESPQANVEDKGTPKRVYHKMIGTGQTIDLGEKGSHEILFFGEDNSPKSFYSNQRIRRLKRFQIQYMLGHRNLQIRKSYWLLKGISPYFASMG